MTVPKHPPLHGGLVAHLRRFWWLHVRRDKGELCQWCGGSYRLWWAPTPLFNRVAAVNEVGLCCPDCFDRHARAQALDLLWVPMVWTTPDGKLGEGHAFMAADCEQAQADWQRIRAQDERSRG